LPSPSPLPLGSWASSFTNISFIFEVHYWSPPKICSFFAFVKFPHPMGAHCLTLEKTEVWFPDPQHTLWLLTLPLGPLTPLRWTEWLLDPSPIAAFPLAPRAHDILTCPFSLLWSPGSSNFITDPPPTMLAFLSTASKGSQNFILLASCLGLPPIHPATLPHPPRVSPLLSEHTVEGVVGLFRPLFLALVHNTSPFDGGQPTCDWGAGCLPVGLAGPR